MDEATKARLTFLEAKMQREERERFQCIDLLRSASQRIQLHEEEIRRLQKERRALLVSRLKLVGAAGGMPIWEEN